MTASKFVGGIFLAIIAAMAISWSLGWIAVPASIISAQNVREQWRFAYEYDESLQSAARKVCAAEKAVQDSISDEEKIQRRSHALALEQNYARIQAEFNARLRDAFQAKLVAPSDVPQRAPELHMMKNQVCAQ